MQYHVETINGLIRQTEKSNDRSIKLISINCGIVFWICICLVFFSQAAFGFEQIMGHARALSLGNAVTSDPPGIMSIHYNPAGLTQLNEGMQLSLGLTLLGTERGDSFEPDYNYEVSSPPNTSKFTAQMDTVAHTTGKAQSYQMYIPFKGPVHSLVMPLPLPLGFSYRKPNAKWVVATGTYFPFSWGSARQDDDPGRFQGKKFYFQHMIYTSPSVGFQVLKSLSFGISIGTGQSALGLDTDIRCQHDQLAETKERGNNIDGIPFFYGGIGPFDSIGTLNFDVRDDFSPSVNIGALFKPVSWFSFGVVYQSEIDINFKGEYQMSYSQELLKTCQWIRQQQILPNKWTQLGQIDKMFESGTIDMDGFKIPQRIQMGVMLHPIPEFRFFFDINWTQWSVNDMISLNFDKKLQLLKLPESLGEPALNQTIAYQLNHKDRWNWGFGIEYIPLENMVFRVGYESKDSHVPDESWNLLSIPQTHYIGTGLGLKLKKGMTLDLALGCHFKQKDSTANNTSINLNAHNPNNLFTAPYEGQNIEVEWRTYIAALNLTMPIEKMRIPGYDWLKSFRSKKEVEE